MHQNIMETERLVLREITAADFTEIALMLQDSEVMYAWEKTFSEAEVWEWIDKNQQRYHNEGYSYFLVSDKVSNTVVGVAGPLIEKIENEAFIGIAYIFKRKYWGYGYAVEAAKACLKYAFEYLQADKVIAQIRPENQRSRQVAKRLGMIEVGSFEKQYQGKVMPHLIYAITQEQYEKMK